MWPDGEDGGGGSAEEDGGGQAFMNRGSVPYPAPNGYHWEWGIYDWVLLSDMDTPADFAAGFPPVSPDEPLIAVGAIGPVVAPPSLSVAPPPNIGGDPLPPDQAAPPIGGANVWGEVLASADPSWVDEENALDAEWQAHAENVFRDRLAESVSALNEVAAGLGDAFFYAPTAGKIRFVDQSFRGQIYWGGSTRLPRIRWDDKPGPQSHVFGKGDR